MEWLNFVAAEIIDIVDDVDELLAYRQLII